MRQFIIFTQKEFYHILRDRWTMIMLVVLPIMMVILFGFGISTEIRNTKVAIFDPSMDQATQGIINKIDNSEYFLVDHFLKSPAKIDAIFREGKAGLVLVFSERFYENMLHTGEAQLQIITDGTDPNTASTLTQYASRIVMDYQQEMLKVDDFPFQIKTEVKLLYNPSMKSAYSTVPGVIGMVLMLICAMMTSVSMTREKEMGTMEVILVSPMHPLMIVLSKVVPYFLISMLNLTTVLLLAVFVLQVPINGSLLLLVLVSMLFIFVSLALGLLISTVVKTQMVALLIPVVGLMMPVILLSGLMFPIENMPLVLQIIAQILPAKWFIEAMRAIMIQGLGVSAITRELLVLGFMAVFLIALSLKKFKIRLE